MRLETTPISSLSSSAVVSMLLNYCRSVCCSAFAPPVTCLAPHHPALDNFICPPAARLHRCFSARRLSKLLLFRSTTSRRRSCALHKTSWRTTLASRAIPRSNLVGHEFGSSERLLTLLSCRSGRLQLRWECRSRIVQFRRRVQHVGALAAEVRGGECEVSAVMAICAGV